MQTWSPKRRLVEYSELLVILETRAVQAVRPFQKHSLVIRIPRRRRTHAQNSASKTWILEM